MNRFPSPDDHAPQDQQDPLMTLLDEWGPTPRVSADFDQRLHRRIAQSGAGRQSAALTGAGSRAWWALPKWVGAMATLLVVAGVGAMLYFNGGPDAANAPTKAAITAPVAIASLQAEPTDPLTRDLQVLNRDGDLLDHLDFLSSTPKASAGVESKD